MVGAMTRLICLMLALAMLSACGLRDRYLPRGGGQSATALPYRASLARAADDARLFAVTARAPGASLEAARESLRFEATRYCLANFGGSDVAWVRDPATGDWAVTRTSDGITATGRCIYRA